MSTGCIICSEVFSSADTSEKYPNAIKTCGHAFHANCLTQWLEKSATCPVCRTPCIDKPEHLVRLHLQSVSNLDVSLAERRSNAALIAAKDAEIANFRTELVELKKFFHENIQQAMEILKKMEETSNLDQTETVMEIIDLCQTFPSDPEPSGATQKMGRTSIGHPSNPRIISTRQLQSGTTRPAGTSIAVVRPGTMAQSTMPVASRKAGLASASARTSGVPARIGPRVMTTERRPYSVRDPYAVREESTVGLTNSALRDRARLANCGRSMSRPERIRK